MKRVMFIGCPGAGKTTLSEKFAKKVGLPIIHLDHLFWKPGWEMVDKPHFKELVAAEIAKDEWVIDGNYGSTMEMRAERADTVVFLDFNNVFCLYRVIKRAIQNKRPQAEGCPQRVDWEFAKFILFDYPKRSRKTAYKLIEQQPETAWYVLRNPRDVKRFMKEFEL